MDFITIDLGASNSRYMTRGGQARIVPNNMYIVSPEDKVELSARPVGKIEDMAYCLDVTISSDNGSQFYPVRALIGDMAERYSANNIKPSTLLNKHVQQINYISAVSITALSRLYEEVPSKVTLYLALPPIEVKTAKDIVRENLIGNYTVKFNAIGKEVSFEIVDVKIFEESFMALLSHFFELNGSAKDKAAQFQKGYVLSLDIGASTTDLAVVKDMRYMEKSGQTYKTGGNIVRDQFMEAVRAAEGYDIDIETAERAIAEGRLQKGNSFTDCSKIVEKAKKDLAESIVIKIQDYFRRIDIPLQSIRAIIVSGGGSLEGSYINDANETVITSSPVSKYITEALNRICESVSIIQADNPRISNVMGLYIRAHIDELMESYNGD